MAQQKRSGGGARKRKAASSGPPVAADGEGRLSVLVELRSERGGSQSMAASQADAIDVPGFELDHEFQVVPLGENQEGLTPLGTAESFVVRGTVADEAEMEGLRADPNVVNVWRDTPIAPFAGVPVRELQTGEGMATCPIPPCDCDPATPKGTLADVATYLEADRLWAAGFRGSGIVVAVADSGLTSLGRPVKEGETPRRIPRVVDGWPADDWGTESSRWSEHGNMCATDVLGMAPDAQLYDLRIAGSGGSPGTVSRALQAFQWAINRHRTDGTPHVISNSWGIYQESWDTAYARNPSHPFVQKVVEAMDEGILVLFAAGNCGATCADSRCSTDNGPGRSIWGANSHPRVMTVGAVNTQEELIGYSSQGPGALDPNKPDFCSISHFTGYNTVRHRHVGRDPDPGRRRGAAGPGRARAHPGRGAGRAARVGQGHRPAGLGPAQRRRHRRRPAGVRPARRRGRARAGARAAAGAARRSAADAAARPPGRARRPAAPARAGALQPHRLGRPARAAGVQRRGRRDRARRGRDRGGQRLPAPAARCQGRRLSRRDQRQLRSSS